ncbi:MAG: heterodisulfide reductase-related iron-sulfur binding cluster [Pseudomonadota bacterium]
MEKIGFDPEICRTCETLDCLTRCGYMKFDLESAREEKTRLIRGEDSRVLRDCVTCYACEEYCPYHNHPFYLIVERQEELGVKPVPDPITKQQLKMMAPRGDLALGPARGPVLDMCYFPMLLGSIKGELFAGLETMVGSDVFCNIMWLHFGKNSAIRERLPRMVENIRNFLPRDGAAREMVCFHDECYGTYTQLAPAFGIDVPFKVVHLFDFLVRRLDELKDKIKPLGLKVAYQRPCSNRLSPETQVYVDQIFQRLGVERVKRKYDGEDALCCGGVLYAMQRDDEADDIQKRNLDDMVEAGAQVCVFNCPACLFTLGEAAAQRGLMPMLMSDLCRAALGEK